MEHKRVNYHGHCNYCRHARGTAREYVPEAVKKRLVRMGFTDHPAYPDVIFVNDFPWDRNCDEACDIIMDGAVKYNFPLEFNANGLRREKRGFAEGERYPFPHKKFWDKVKGTEIKVCVGSDCHEPGHVYNDLVIKSDEMLADMGIPVCTEF